MAVKLGSNITALGVQRFLNNASREVSLSSERLSSGMRINRSSDDAAGLAIASKLHADSRVYGQGIRNVNDAISLLNVAQGGAGELTSILTRLKELAQGAANGTLSVLQRHSLDGEADQLIEEYNRITQTTSFNGRQLLNGGVGRLVIQAGYGSSESFNFSLGEDLKRVTGDGTFVAGALLNGGTDLVAAGDFNRDGKQDLAGALTVVSTGAVTLRLGSGDGTFGAQNIIASLPAGVSTITDLKAADIDGDGNLDIVSAGADGIRVFRGNGDGNFKAAQLVTATNTTSVAIADLNADGISDIVSVRTTTNSVYLGTGNGNFGSAINFAGRRSNVNTADFNGDGVLDIITSGTGATMINLGAGNGTFGDNILVGNFAGRYMLGDFDDDGNIDIMGTSVSVAGDIALIRGNGDTTFKAAQQIVTGQFVTAFAESPLDVNGDGILDITYTNSSGELSVILATGDGTFAGKGTTYGTGATVSSLTAADFNSDGVADFISAGSTSIPKIYTSNTQELTSIATLNLNTRQSALDAISIFDTALQRVSKELGTIGSSQSRLQSGLSNLLSRKENLEAAASRIVDVDVAEESARLLRYTLLQQAGAALLSQANQQPALVVRLLSS